MTTAMIVTVIVNAIKKGKGQSPNPLFSLSIILIILDKVLGWCPTQIASKH